MIRPRGDCRWALPLFPVTIPLAKPSTRNSNLCLADTLVVDCADSLTRPLSRSAYRSCRARDVNLRRRSKVDRAEATVYLRFFAALFFFADFFAADFVFDFAFFAMLLS